MYRILVFAVLFGCLANSWPGSPEPTSERSVACSSTSARLYQYKEGQPIQGGAFSQARWERGDRAFPRSLAPLMHLLELAHLPGLSHGALSSRARHATAELAGARPRPAKPQLARPPEAAAKLL
jgi:hypothetical protein